MHLHDVLEGLSVTEMYSDAPKGQQRAIPIIQTRAGQYQICGGLTVESLVDGAATSHLCYVLLPEYITCKDWMAAVILPASAQRNLQGISAIAKLIFLTSTALAVCHRFSFDHVLLYVAQ